MKILIVDDERAMRKLLSMMLAPNHDVLAVGGVDEALQELTTGQWDILLTDYKMPGKSGLELIEHLMAEGSTLPVILITGQGSRDDNITRVRTRVHKILAKPFSHEVLLAAITELAPASAG